MSLEKLNVLMIPAYGIPILKVLSQEPIAPTPAPTHPFQKVCADYFEAQGRSYLTYIYCFSGWISIVHFKLHQTTS